MDATLLLNADGMPVNLLPLSSMSWQEAIKSLWVGTTEVLHYYENWVVHSPSMTLEVPAVCILKEQVKVKRNMRLNEHSASANLLFLRDGFQCQYCRGYFHRSQLTLDHVLPKKFGGRSTYTNLTSACSTCNGKRGHDVRIQPANPPYRPTYEQLVKKMRQFPINVPHHSWNWFLGWDSSLVNVFDPLGDNAPAHLNENLVFA